MKKYIQILATSTSFLFLFISGLRGQATYVHRVTFGSSSLQEARRIIKTPDNQYLVVGYVANNDTSLNRDGLVFKMEEDGTITWAKKYGGSNWEEFYDVVQSGSHYYCIGYTRTWVYGTFGTPNNLTADIFVVKLKLDGTVVWAKNMGKPTNGSSAGDGNEYGLRGIASAQGGVIVVTRMNIGLGSNQNSGLIWVDSDGTVRWAYQYNFPIWSGANELTQGIWRDGAQTYVVGGWFRKFSSPDTTGAFLHKIDQNGAIIWQKYTKVTSSQFASQYSGYYNLNNGKIYTTDFYNQSSSTIREIQVMTNMADTGNPPSAGAIPQAKRFHYGTAGSSTNNHRAFIFPVGDGYDQFILGASEVTGATSGVTRRATIIASTPDFTYQWTKKIGSSLNSSQSQINDLLTCENNTHSLIVVGTVNRLVSGIVRRDVMVTKVNSSSSVLDCEYSSSINNSNLSLTASNTNLVLIDLKAICSGGHCWADDNLISSITVTTLTGSVTQECVGSEPPPEESLTYIEPVESKSGASLSSLAFKFSKQPKEVYFEITDVTGDFVYERFFDNLGKLESGLNIQDMKLEHNEYVWEIQAVYDDKKGIEVKRGMFKIE